MCGRSKPMFNVAATYLHKMVHVVCFLITRRMSEDLKFCYCTLLWRTTYVEGLKFHYWTFRPAKNSRKALEFTAESFSHPDSNYRDVRSATRQKSILSLAGKIDRDISHFSPNLVGSKKIQNLASLWFRNKNLCSIVLKFDILVLCGSTEDRGCNIVKIHFSQIQDGGRHPNWTYWNRNKAAADCSISLEFGTQCDDVTADVLQTFRVKW